MSKFKVGDKVRVVCTVTDTNKWIGKEFTVSHVDMGVSYPISVSSNAGPFDEIELELVTEQETLEQGLEEIKARVAELEKRVEGAKPTAANLPTLTRVIVNSTNEFIKIASNSWVIYDKTLTCARRDSIAVHRDVDIDYRGFEVINEGI